MLAVAEGGVGRPALHQISKLAQRDVEHSQETEIISADQLTGAEVSFCMRDAYQAPACTELHSSVASLIAPETIRND